MGLQKPEAIQAELERLGSKLTGRYSTKVEAQLASNLGGVIPEWYIELLREYPLGDLGFVYGDWAVNWFGLASVVEEAKEFVPGVYVLRHGFIPVAGCGTGSGDPFFVKFDSTDPALLQIFHGSVGSDGVLHANSLRQVAPRLSAFFAQARCSGRWR